MSPSLRLVCVGLSGCALALAGCAAGDDRAAAAAATAAAAAAAAGGSGTTMLVRMAGMWNGRTRPVSPAARTNTFRIVQTADSAGWTLIFPGDTARRRIPGHLVAAQGDSLVALWGPYDADLGNGATRRVLTRSVARLWNGRMVGTYDLRPWSAPDSIVGRGRFEATRVP